MLTNESYYLNIDNVPFVSSVRGVLLKDSTFWDLVPKKQNKNKQGYKNPQPSGLCFSWLPSGTFQTVDLSEDALGYRRYISSCEF